MVRTGHDAGTNALRDPRPVDRVPDLGRHPHQVAGLHSQTFRVNGMDPERVGVGDFVTIDGEG